MGRELLIEASKKSALNGTEMFLRNFSKVPDDKLTWQATPTAKSALRIAAHTALYMGRFASMINARSTPVVDDIDAWVAKNVAEEIAITTREQVEQAFRRGTEEVVAALDGLTPEDTALIIDSGQGWTMPMTFLMNLPGWHAAVHMGQIDFLQTCWDDQEIYVG